MENGELHENSTTFSTLHRECYRPSKKHEVVYIGFNTHIMENRYVVGKLLENGGGQKHFRRDIHVIRFEISQVSDTSESCCSKKIYRTLASKSISKMLVS